MITNFFVNKSIRLLFVSTLFILSGVSALIYQVAWFKYLSYFLGSTSYTQSIVLATFMGGLAIGAWFFGKTADKTKNSLKLFAWLEISIAIYCFLFFQIFDFVKDLFSSIVISQKIPSDSFTVLVLKLILSSVNFTYSNNLNGWNTSNIG
jgi:predicted MFS family arabinose efflux permease